MTALSDALIYSSPLLGEMDLLEIAEIDAHYKWLQKKAGVLWELTYGCCISLYVCKSCISGSLLHKAQTEIHVYFPPPLSLDVFASEKAFKCLHRLLNCHASNQYCLYLCSACTANLFSDTLLVTWNLYYKHQTRLPMCRKGTEYLSRAHTDEHRCTSICVER